VSPVAECMAHTSASVRTADLRQTSMRCNRGGRPKTNKTLCHPPSFKSTRRAIWAKRLFHPPSRAGDPQTKQPPSRPGAPLGKIPYIADRRPRRCCGPRAVSIPTDEQMEVPHRTGRADGASINLRDRGLDIRQSTLGDAQQLPVALDVPSFRAGGPISQGQVARAAKPTSD